MVDVTWRPGVDDDSGMAAYYRGREKHERELAIEAHRQWKLYAGLAEKYRLLADRAEVIEYHFGKSAAPTQLSATH